MKWLGVSKFLTLFLQTYTFCCFIRELGSFVKSVYVCSVCTIFSLVSLQELNKLTKRTISVTKHPSCYSPFYPKCLHLGVVITISKQTHFLETHAYYLLLTSWHELDSYVGFPYLGQYFLMNHTKLVKVHPQIHGK